MRLRYSHPSKTHMLYVVNLSHTPLSSWNSLLSKGLGFVPMSLSLAWPRSFSEFSITCIPDDYTIVCLSSYYFHPFRIGNYSIHIEPIFPYPNTKICLKFWRVIINTLWGFCPKITQSLSAIILLRISMEHWDPFLSTNPDVLQRQIRETS